MLRIFVGEDIDYCLLIIMGIGGEILNYIGGCVRFVYGIIWRTIFNKKKYSFNEYINGPNNSNDWFDLLGHTVINRFIGFITIGIICWILFYINIKY